jgi:hypothetical protein
MMNVVRDTPSSDGALVYKVSSNYLERIKSYGPDKLIPHLTLNYDLDLRVIVTRVVCDGACEYDSMKCRHIILSGLKVMARTSKTPHLNVDL